MDRVCGASAERELAQQKRCWCRGLFCGRAGARMSAEFRREFRLYGHASSRVDIERQMRQADLFDGDAARQKWIGRLDTHATPRRPIGAP